MKALPELEKGSCDQYQHKYLLRWKAGLSGQFLGIPAWHYLPSWPWPVLMPLFPRVLLFSPSPAEPLEDPWLRYRTHRSRHRTWQHWVLSGSWWCGKCVLNAMESISLKVLLDSLGFLFKESLNSCLTTSSILCSYICSYMVKIDGQWIQNIFCENVMKLISLRFIQAGSMWKTSPWLWVEVGWFLDCFPLCLLFAFEIRKER